MAVRKNQANLSAAERRAFIDALLTLKARGAYDKYVEVHDYFATNDLDDAERTGHSAPSFLPWHRKFLLDFERDLQTVNPSVTLPYWDWTVDRTTTSPMRPDFLGTTGRAGDSQVMDGPFAYSGGKWKIYLGTDERPFLRRDIGSTDMLPTAAQVESALSIAHYDEAPWNGRSVGGFRNVLEGWANRNTGPHNAVHRYIGGAMNSGKSPNDPVFWMHHCFIDKLWVEWQRRHPGSGYLPVTPVKDVVALNQPMKPWSERGERITPADMLDHTRFYTYE
ncbi:tyrosinase family protein [Streptomyces sp. NPDC059002]|uniref:tyrosinase family protein n=1 Tax=Streptomyces sp. NPDC059002 TaxID=3346690 RepID=UPI00367AECE0